MVVWVVMSNDNGFGPIPQQVFLDKKLAEKYTETYGGWWCESFIDHDEIWKYFA